MKVKGIIVNNGIRYIIIDEKTGEIIDDEQGYGYKSKQNAYKVLNYKFRGGKKKLIEYEAFGKRNKQIAEHIREIYIIHYKEIISKEITVDDIIQDISNTFKTNIPKNLLNHYELAFKGVKKVIDNSKTIK